MARSISRLATVLAVLAAVTVAACSASGSQPRTPSSASTAATPVSLSGSSSADGIARAQAIAEVSKYFEELDDLYLNPATPLTDVYSVATDSEARIELSSLVQYRSLSYRQTGYSVIVHVTSEMVDLSPNPNSVPAQYPFVVVTACVDVSGVGAIDANGTSVAPLDHPKYLVSTLTLVNIHYPDSASWRVSAAPNQQQQSCKN